MPVPLADRRTTVLDQSQIDPEAFQRIERLREALSRAGCQGHNLECFLVRTIFCLFADHTGIFKPHGIFTDLIETRTRLDGTDLEGRLCQLFQALDSPETGSRNDLARFPAINSELFGADLFGDVLRMPAFDGAIRARLLEAAQLDWSRVSPTIFGALFQSGMDLEERRTRGAHYTCERNILELIEPLFLEELRAQFGRLQSRKNGREESLRLFQRRLGELKFLDPACGCGNFLIVTYRELRLLEVKVIRELHALGGDIGKSRPEAVVNAGQFHGIEIGKFATQVAAVALWMMDRILDKHLSLEFGQACIRLPSAAAPQLVCADALQTDWANVLPPSECSYVFGNPPFGGFVMRRESERKRLRAVVKALGASGSRLDYAAAWFLKAGAYLRGQPARIAFVATSSITQGEQVAQFWPTLFERYGLEISFGRRAFRWIPAQPCAAHVHAVILGLVDRDSAPLHRRLFITGRSGTASEEVRLQRISPYLTDAGHLNDPHLVIERRRSSISGFPRIGVGSKPVDGGHYILDAKDRQELLKREPRAARLVRPFVGGREYLNGNERWILFLEGESASALKSMPAIMERIQAVRRYRASEAGKLGQSLAGKPTEFHVTVAPAAEFLVIPEVSSERREYVPIGYLKPPVIPSNQLLVVEDATLPLFALLTSAMHMAWLRHVGGRLKSDYRSSNGLVYNTFPAPIRAPDLAPLKALAQAVFAARAAHPKATLADLYDPDLMPPDLRQAHVRLDRAVDRLYRHGGFRSERDRIEHLLARYEGIQAHPNAKLETVSRRSRRVRLVGRA